MDIETLVEQVARELLDVLPSLQSATPIDQDMAITRALLGGQGCGPTLMAAFREDPSFGYLRGGWLQFPDLGGHIIQDHVIPRRLVKRVIAGASAKSVVEEVREFVAAGSCRTVFYTAIAGATVTETISVDENMEILPWSNVPNIDQKNIFSGNLPKLDFSTQEPTLTGYQSNANMAFRMWSAESQALFSSSDEANKKMRSDRTSIMNFRLKIEDLIRCITLASGRSVVAIGSWGLLDKEIANNLMGPAFSFEGTLFDRDIYVSSLNPLTLSSDSITHLVKRFNVFDEAGKQPLRVCMDRFNQALRRSNLVDRAIDLGIALEVMLLHGIGSEIRGEMKYRFSARGAMFLGGDRRYRLSTFEALKNIYDLRSRAVHSGVLTAKQNKTKPEETLTRAEGIWRDVATKLLERGSFPEWDEEYVIGHN